ncbi:hypothetical protein LTS12_028159 [Elasticomyces elasticus]|nr:hypothetical protein LTS12_028159 [Elasticomyces elasticus]
MFDVLEKRGGPYASTTASMGGLPSVIPDIPVCAVFMALYISFAATNMTIFQKNRRRGHKFVLSAMMFGFCMARITTLVLRIVWATRQHNVRLAIAANIFVNAGILLVYIINLILAQRILRAKQPRIGWNPIIRHSTKAFYILIGGALIMVITSTVISVYTLNPSFKTGVNWTQPRPATEPMWYHKKASFYVFNFTLEILILCLLTFSRIDKRFFIPNGSTRPGDYSSLPKQKSEGSDSAEP